MAICGNSLHSVYNFEGKIFCFLGVYKFTRLSIYPSNDLRFLVSSVRYPNEQTEFSEVLLDGFSCFKSDLIVSYFVC